MENKLKKASLFFLTALSSTALSKPQPTDVIGRNLDIPGAGWAGHVGIVTANKVRDSGDYVVEALWEPLVLQINTLNNFKTRSPYWGAKYGINQNDNTGTRIILEGAFQTSLKCAEYTLTVYYKPGKGQWGVPSLCPKFRCDTFVNYLYAWGGYILPTYNPPETAGNATIPLYVFNSFPAYRANNFNTINTPSYSPIIKTPLNSALSINNATVEQLEALTIEEFHQAVDLPVEKLSQKGKENILKFSDNKTLSYEKRLFLLDKLGFVVFPEMLPKIIELFYKNQDDENLSHMIIRSTQDLYQENNLLLNYAKKKKNLKDFYLMLMDKKLPPQTIAIVIRGITSLHSVAEIFENRKKIDLLLENELLDKSIAISLKTNLAFKSKSLGKIYFNGIIDELIRENSDELNTFFYGAVAAKLGRDGINSIDESSKLFMKEHLSSLYSRFNNRYKDSHINNLPLPQSSGIWLEATALISSSSLEEAGKYIAEVLSHSKIKEQENYMLGFSNNKYLKQAFNKEAILIQFKKSHRQLYEDVIELKR